MPLDERQLAAHRAWLGLLQPVGLVVSPPALAKAGAFPVEGSSGVELQQRLLEVVERPGERAASDAKPHVPNLVRLLEHVLDWRRDDLRGAGCTAQVPSAFEVVLPTYGEVLRPTWAAMDPVERDRAVLLIQSHPRGTKLDDAPDDRGTGWHASPQAKFERLLTETGVRTGLIANGDEVRLVHVPEHQTSGHLTFPVAAMCEIGGRPILAAFDMLLRGNVVFGAPPGRSLFEILADSRNYQNEVSNQLAEQVLGALWELLRGFQVAEPPAAGAFLPSETPEDREHLYGGLLTTLMRMVFLLYAEDQGLLPNDPVWAANYSVAGLYRRLRDDQAANPDTMDNRFGAWSSLLAIFRVIYRGGGHQPFRLPARKGQLFDPDAFPFLEGRRRGSIHAPAAHIEAPRVSDGCIFRVLQGLLVLDGERLSYRALDVEQIGSVYEAMMGYVVERVTGASVALRFRGKGIPGLIFLDVDALLAKPGRDRTKWIEEHALCKLAVGAAARLRDASTPDAVLAALDRRVSPKTPRALPPGTLVLQPGEERRRSGSHYTPRILTKPIVETTLRPVLEALGSNPTPEQILELKVCDPAMGSGAFLVEACRQLAERLVAAWDRHARTPILPPDEDALLHAKRLVAQRCLYGVDKNPFAVSLAKLSLWLVTLARDHAFTFLDHALKNGDSLVGLSAEQIVRFHWDAGKTEPLPLLACIREDTRAASERRTEIEGFGDEDEDAKREKLIQAESAQARARLAGDLVVGAYFASVKPDVRDLRIVEYRQMLDQARSSHSDALKRIVAALRIGPGAVLPFHWEIEFPEIFVRQNAGFDVIVGNPPFLGGTLIGGRLGLTYHDFLIEAHEPATGLADLVSFFLRRAFSLLRSRGAFGLIATNTVAQGDTRTAGLTTILEKGGSIYEARRRYMWPGEASVIVSIVHVAKTPHADAPLLDDVQVDRISAFLLRGNADRMPLALIENRRTAYRGTEVWGAGFVFESEPSNGSSSLAELERFVTADARNRDVVFPFVGAEEFNESPSQSSSRFVIDFGDRTEAEARRWIDLFSILEDRVRPIRAKNKQRNYRENWWLHANRVREAAPYAHRHGRLLVLACVSPHVSVAFVGGATVVSNSMVLVLLHGYGDFAVVQSRVHEVWARMFGSSMKDDLRYTTACFETFPRPVKSDSSHVQAIGATYYEVRAKLMLRNREGLTRTYNRCHNPEERDPEIVRLRELHDAMDRAVLDAYGWTDIRPTCAFLLDYEINEDEYARKKKPYRYRWPDDVRDEVLRRLLELNRVRAEQERLAGPALMGSKIPSLDGARRLSRAKRVAEDTPLFGKPPDVDGDEETE